jgi:hypothetical protein
MNYASLTEAWGERDSDVVSKSALKKFTLASMRHPLLRKEPEAEVPKEAAIDVEEVETPYESKEHAAASRFRPSEDSVRAFLKKAFREDGVEGVEDLLPVGYLRAVAQEQKPPASTSLFGDLEIEDIARMVLVAAIAYVVVDLFMRR